MTVMGLDPGLTDEVWFDRMFVRVEAVQVEYRFVGHDRGGVVVSLAVAAAGDGAG